jgi:hypothetical protein
MVQHAAAIIRTWITPRSGRGFSGFAGRARRRRPLAAYRRHLELPWLARVEPQAAGPGQASGCCLMITVRKVTRSLAAVMPGWLVVVCGVCLVIPPAGWRHCCSPPGCAWFSPRESAARRARERAASRTALAVRCLACASVQPATAVTRERGCPRPLRSRREGIATRSDARRRHPAPGSAGPAGWGNREEQTGELRVQPYSGK